MLALAGVLTVAGVGGSEPAHAGSGCGFAGVGARADTMLGAGAPLIEPTPGGARLPCPFQKLAGEVTRKIGRASCRERV